MTQPLHGSFLVHADEGPLNFSDLPSALAMAEEIAVTKVRAMCSSAGATEMEIELSRNDNHVHHDLDGDLFLEARVTATATGRPDCRTLASGG